MITFEYKGADGNTHIRSWHYSQSLPDDLLSARVLKITADGDELDLLLHAIRGTIKPVKVIDVTPSLGEKP